MRRSTALLSSTIAFAVLYGAAAVALGTTPDAADSGGVAVAWFRDNSDHVRLWLWFVTIALVIFVVYAALVRSWLPPIHRDVFFAGAVLLVAETTVQGWVWAGMASHAQMLQPTTARTLLDIVSYWGPVLTSATVLMLAPATLVAFRGGAGLPRWLSYVTGVALVEQLVETITIFGNRGFLAPGGPMNLVLGAGLTAIALITLGVVVSRSMPT